MTRLGRHAVALACAALAACGDSSYAPSGPTRLVPDAKAPRDERFLVWGEAVTIAGVSRRVLSSSKSVMPSADITGASDAQRRVTVRIPPEFSAVPWAVYELVTLVDDRVMPVRVWPISGRQAGSTYGAGVIAERVPPGGTPGVRLWPVPDLAARDVETEDVRVPADAVLKLAVGLEPPSWDTTVMPVDMVVSTVEGGTATALSTTRLDVRKPEHQRWVDVVVPLDALAGRSVRFRFSARPVAGGTAAPSLPVWAEPTIVDVHQRAR
jgi:hypothetical protein